MTCGRLCLTADHGAAGPGSLDRQQAHRRRRQPRRKDPVPMAWRRGAPQGAPKAMIFSCRSVGTKWLALSAFALVTFIWRRQMKVTRPPGRTPGWAWAASEAKTEQTRRKSRPHRRRLHRHARGPLRQVQLQLHQLRRAGRERLGAHAGHAAAQAPLQRAQALPFEPVDRVAGRVRLRDRRLPPRRPPARSSWHCAQDRSSWPMRCRYSASPRCATRLQARVGRRRDRQAARLHARRSVSQRQQLARSRRPAPAAAGGAARHRLMRCARSTGRPQRGVEGRVARRRRRASLAPRRRGSRRRLRPLRGARAPQRLAVVHPQHAPGSARRRAACACMRRRPCRRSRSGAVVGAAPAARSRAAAPAASAGERAAPRHVDRAARTLSVCAKPLSPSQLKRSVPLAVGAQCEREVGVGGDRPGTGRRRRPARRRSGTRSGGRCRAAAAAVGAGPVAGLHRVRDQRADLDRPRRGARSAGTVIRARAMRGSRPRCTRPA